MFLCCRSRMEATVKLDFDEKRKLIDIDKAQLAQIFDKFRTFGLAPLYMQGHEDSLFRKHMSFSNAYKDMSNPMMKASESNVEYVDIDYDAEFASFMALLSAVSVALSSVKPSTTNVSDDVEVLDTVLRCFVPFPALSYKEIYLEYGSKNHLVGGKIDLMVGSCSNDNKPVVKVLEKSRDSGVRNVHLASIGEGKTTDVPLLPMSSVNSAFNMDVKQNLSLVQPMVELMAISEVCNENQLVPVINIFGNRENFRPFLYFHEYDVMLTTPKPFTYMLDNKTLCLNGLIMLHLLCNIHRYLFYADKLRSIQSTGWAKAKSDYNPTAYQGSVVTDEAPKSASKNTNRMDPHFHTESKRANDLKRWYASEAGPSQSKRQKE